MLANALGRDDIETIDWQYESLHSGGGQFYGVQGLVRFRGHVRLRGSAEPAAWSMVLKAFARDPDSGDEDITHPTYWKREVLAYQSGLVRDLSPALTGARCYGVVEYPGEVFWVWLEDLADGWHEPWPIATYGVAAECLGRFNGAYLTGKAMPRFPWLSHGRVRRMLDLAAPVIERLDERRDEPVVQRWLGDDRLERVQRLWSTRDHLLQGLASLPRCLCHHDAFCRNLVVRQNEDGAAALVGIDWAMMGTGVIGEELGPLVGATLYFLDVDAEDAPALDRIAFDGYVRGLGDDGWRGDARLARFGYAATQALSGGIGVLGYLDFVKERGQVESFWGLPYDRVMDSLGPQLQYKLDLGD